jgi:hypothetical protein
MMPNRVILHTVELERVKAFMDEEHDNRICKSRTVIIETSGGSGIGTNAYAICGKCGKKQDVTCYENW